MGFGGLRVGCIESASGTGRASAIGGWYSKFAENQSHGANTHFMYIASLSAEMPTSRV